MSNNNCRDSRTYKLKIPDNISKHALYFTVVGAPGSPEAFFINSKSMESFQFITALMTSYSRQLKNGDSLENVIQDMKGIFDPNGAYIIPDGSGRKVHSVVHHLGLILEQD